MLCAGLVCVYETVDKPCNQSVCACDNRNESLIEAERRAADNLSTVKIRANELAAKISTLTEERDKARLRFSALISVTLTLYKLFVLFGRVDNVEHAAQTPSGLADILGLSPSTKETVATLSAQGVMRSASSASPDAKGRNYFMSRVSRAYTPIVEKILSNPTFEGEPQP